MTHASSNSEDPDGFIIPRCTCGWEAPAVDHAYMAGVRAIEAETPQVFG